MTFSQIFQTTYSDREGVAYLGQQWGERRADVYPRIMRGLGKAGYGVFKVAGIGSAGTSSMDPGEVFQIPSPASDADADAIILSTASPSSNTTYTTLSGVVGGLEMQPPRKITLTLSNHANWDLTTAVLRGVNQNGQIVTENLAIPDGGNTTVTSTGYFMSVISLYIPAQSGTSGTFTLGVAALASLALVDFMGVLRYNALKTTLRSSPLYYGPGTTSLTQTADYCDNDTVDVVREGGLWVFTEEATSDRDPVYVRVAAGAGGSVIGAFRNDDDSSSCVLLPGSRFTKDCAAGQGRLYLASNG